MKDFAHAIMKSVILASVFLFTATLSIAQRKPIVFATYTYSTNNRVQNLQPLATWLSKETGVEISVVSYPTVKALINAIETNSVDIAMMNTSGYLVLQRNHPGKVKPLVNLDMGNTQQTNYAGCLITLSRNNIHSLREAINQKAKLALVESSSTSGNLMPRLMLNSKGIASAEQHFDVYYAGTHRQVVDDVLNGKALIGGCGCAEVIAAQARLAEGNTIQVLDEFNNIPLGPIVFNTKMEGNQVSKIKKALLKVHREEPEVFVNFCNGWTEFKSAVKFKSVADKDYDSFRKMFGNNVNLWSLIE